MKKVKVFAPATVANVAVGFDIMGFALDDIGDTLEFEKTNTGKIEIVSITGIHGITTNPKKNTATIGIQKLLKDKKENFGLKIKINKGISIGSGMGGSAASAVAGVFGASMFLKKKINKYEIFKYALEGEAFASGSKHPDNVSPCLLGGFVYTHSMQPFEPYSIILPKNTYCVLLHPQIRIDTKKARSILKPHVKLSTFIEQNKNLTGFLLGLQASNIDLIKKSFHDLVIEPQRAKLIPNFYKVKKSALNSGAFGCSISGSGPTIFALVIGKEKAKKVLLSMKKAYGKKPNDSWISQISSKGVRIL